MQKLNEAIEFHHSGDLIAAQKRYKHIVSLYPEHGETNYLLGLVYAQQQKYYEALAYFRKAVEVDPQNCEYLRDLGVCHIKLNDYHAALACLEQAKRFDPKHKPLYCLLSDIYQKTGQNAKAADVLYEALSILKKKEVIHNRLAAIYADQGDLKKAIVHCKEALKYNPDDQTAHYNWQTYLSLLKHHSPSDYQLAPPGTQDHNILFIACMPKSGSSYLAEILCQLFNYPKVPFKFLLGENEQDIYLPNLIKSQNGNCVVQQHVRATNVNYPLMKAFNINPIVMVRNIFDIIASLYDQYNKGKTLMPMAIVTHYDKINREEKLDFIIDMVLPWYFNFFASWQRIHGKSRYDIHWLSYETLLRQPVETVRQACNFLGFSKDTDSIEAAIDAAQGQDTKFNKGVIGRGLPMLSEDQIRRVYRYKRYYPDCDYHWIGLEKDVDAGV